MFVIKVKSNETDINKYTDEKNFNHLQVRPVTRTETIFRIFLTSQETSIETNLNYSHLKYSSCTFFRS